MIRTFDCLRFVYKILFLTSLIIHFSCQKEDQFNKNDTFDFSLMTIDGEKIDLKDFRGEKIVHLVFWSTWCTKCLMEMPKLMSLWGTKGTKPYEILAINVGLSESQDRIKRIQKKYLQSFKVVLDEKREVTKKFNVISIPYHIIIDKEGHIKDRFNKLPENPANYFNKLFSS